MDISAIAFQGLERAQTQFGQAARNLASPVSPSPDGSGVDSVSLSEQTVSLLSAKNAFEMNVSVMKIANEMEGRAIDLLR